MQHVLVISRRWDSRGFWFHGRPVGTLAFHWWKLWRTWPSFLLRVDFGNGAGSIWGCTFYLGVNVKGGGAKYLYARAPFRIGFTRNANHVPYNFGG